MKNYRTWMHQRGVTLIELLIVVVIISILSAVAIPGYRRHVMRVNRTDAKRELLAMAGRLERCFTRTNNYTRLDDVPNACVTLPFTNAEGTYRLTATNYTATTYLLTATPLGAQASDAQCLAFTVDQIGTQGITGSGTAMGCWGGRQN